MFKYLYSILNFMQKKNKGLEETVVVNKHPDSFEGDIDNLKKILDQFSMVYFSSELTNSQKPKIGLLANQIVSEYLEKFLIYLRPVIPKRLFGDNYLGDPEDRPRNKPEPIRYRESQARNDTIRIFLMRRKGFFGITMSDVHRNASDFVMCEEDFYKLKEYFFTDRHIWLKAQQGLRGIVNLNEKYWRAGLRVVEFSMPDYASPVIVHAAFNTLRIKPSSESR